MSEIGNIREKGTIAVGKLRESKTDAEEGGLQLSLARAVSEGLLKEAIATSKEHGEGLREGLTASIGHLAGLLAGMELVKSQAKDTQELAAKGGNNVTRAHMKTSEAAATLEGAFSQEEIASYTKDVLIISSRAERSAVGAERTAVEIMRRSETNDRSLRPLTETLQEALERVMLVAATIDTWGKANKELGEVRLTEGELGARDVAETAQDSAERLQQRVDKL